MGRYGHGSSVPARLALAIAALLAGGASAADRARDAAAPPGRIEPVQALGDHAGWTLDGWAQSHPQGLTGERDPATLLRRLHMDLTGEPPSREAVAAYASDPSDAAYRAMVERLIGSQAYGERWAAWWMRTLGGEGRPGGSLRIVREYERWVARSFAEGVAFDDFTRRQLTGDAAETALAVFGSMGGYLPADAGGGMRGRDAEVVARAWLEIDLMPKARDDDRQAALKTQTRVALAALLAGDAVGADAGDTHAGVAAEDAARVAALESDLQRLAGKLESVEEMLRRTQEEWERCCAFTDFNGDGIVDASDLPGEVGRMIDIAPYDRSASQMAIVRRFYFETDLTHQAVRDDYAATLRALRELGWRAPAVDPLPSELGGGSERVNDRAALAEWLVSPDNPRTARAVARRLSDALLPNAMAAAGDEGRAALVDGLAAELVAGGWSFDGLMRTIVTSRVYRGGG